VKQHGWTPCLVLALWASAGLASEPDFQFSRSITTPSLTQEELLAVTIDAAVFAATQLGLPDVRLLDGQGGAVPYLLHKVQASRFDSVQKTWAAAEPAVRILEEGGLEITVRLRQEDPQPHGLRLVSRLKNFEHRVRVFSADAPGAWEPAGDETVIFDYSRYLDVRQDTIRFKPVPHRHFRIVIDNVTAQQESELLALTRRLRGAEETEREEQVTIKRRPFRIERIEFWGETEREVSTGDKKTDYALTNLREEHDSEQQQTRVLVDSGREPLTSLALQTPARNFSRRVAVEVQEKRGVTSAWREIGAGTLSRIDFKALQQEQLTIRIPETRRDSYRLVIDNRDSSALKVTGIEARGNLYQLLFLATPETSYRLVYGSIDVAAPQFDTAAIERVLREGFQPAQAELGAVTPGTGQPGAFRWSQLLNHRAVLFGAIILLVIILAWGLLHAMKRVDSLPPE